MVGGRVEREGEDAGGAGLCSEKWGSCEKPWVRVSPRLCELWDAPGSLAALGSRFSGHGPPPCPARGSVSGQLLSLEAAAYVSVPPPPPFSLPSLSSLCPAQYLLSTWV